MLIMLKVPAGHPLNPVRLTANCSRLCLQKAAKVLRQGELETREARLISLGAKKSSHQDPNDPGLIVMLDPTEHPFCIFENPDPVTFRPPPL